MDYDKYIGGRKLKKMGHSHQENEEIERRAILSIRSNAETLSTLLEEISMYSPSMVSPTASPIKHHTNSNTTFNYTPIKQFVQASTFKKPNKQEKQQNNPQIKPLKKKSISSVHFTNYMKPIGKISEKFKGVLQKQIKTREMEEERDLQRINSIKQRARQQYSNIQPKYQQYEHRNSSKQEAIANRLIERQEEEMSGVTFMPKINTNIEINQSFDTRLIQSERKKQQKSSQIIKQVLKDQTYHPKINKNKPCESKIKSIWLKPTKKVDSQSSLSNSFRQQCHNFKQLFSPPALKMKTISEFDFMNKK